MIQLIATNFTFTVFALPSLIAYIYHTFLRLCIFRGQKVRKSWLRLPPKIYSLIHSGNKISQAHTHTSAMLITKTNTKKLQVTNAIIINEKNDNKN